MLQALRRASIRVAVTPVAVETGAKRQKLLLGALSLIGGGSLAFGASLAKRFSVHAEAAASNTFPRYTLYQYQVCPFCNKAQAFLEFAEVPHQRVEVNPLSKKEMKFSEYKMVPFMVVETAPGQKKQVNGSDAIVDFIASDAKPGTVSEKDPEDVKKWRDWVNDRLVKLLPPNIYRTPGEALQAFDYISKSSNFSLYERISAKYAGALAMFFIAKKSLTKYNIKDARTELAAEMNKWAEQGLKDGKGDFHGGKRPDRADLAVFGVIRSIEGNYATWEDMQKNVNIKFWTWYGKMKSQVKPPVLQQ
jgi:microsomal prostaglandin-E synthase 2